MKIWIALTVAAFAVLASAECPQCETMKWASCYGTPCQCFLAVGNATKEKLDCTKLIPKCFLMQAEMHRAREGQKTRTIIGKSVESAEENYDPECESDGKFQPRQCNNSEECWCVNSAGIRRTCKEDKNLKCGKLAETIWVNLRLTHKRLPTPLNTTTLKADIADAIHKRYKNFSKDLVKDVKYDPKERSIVVDVKMGNRSSDLTGISDLAGMAYYMENDVKGLTLFTYEDKRFQPIVGSQRLEIEDIKVNYIDEKGPDFCLIVNHVYYSVITPVVVVVVSLVVWFCYKKHQNP